MQASDKRAVIERLYGAWVQTDEPLARFILNAAQWRMVCPLGNAQDSVLCDSVEAYAAMRGRNPR